MGRLGIPLASPIFCWFFETIHDPLSEIPCPLGPNVHSWDTLGASRELTFPLNATCVGTMGRMSIPLAFPSFADFLDHSRPSQCKTLPPMGNVRLHLANYSHLTIHDPLSALIFPLGPNVDRWAALKTSTEPTFPVFVICVGPVGRLGIPSASLIFCGFFETIHGLLSALPW